MDILSQILFESQHTKKDVDAERKVVMKRLNEQKIIRKTKLMMN